MSIGDGIAVAGCVWSAAWLFQQYTRGRRLERLANVLAAAVSQITDAIHKATK